jgi:hypothetical protein
VLAAGAVGAANRLASTHSVRPHCVRPVPAEPAS